MSNSVPNALKQANVVKPVSGNVVKPAANASANAAKNVGKTLDEGKKTISNSISGFWVWLKSNDTAVIILIAVTILLFILVIVYIVFSMKSSNLKGKMLCDKPLKLDQMSTPLEIAESDIPPASVGREYSYSFWLYLEDFQPTPDNHKLIFYRGSENSMTSANPIVFLDGLTNKLYIAIKTQGNTLDSSNIVNYGKGDLNDLIDYNYFINKNGDKNKLVVTPFQSSINMYLIMAIDYVPLQRWVNIVTIVDNKLITIYIDGEIYSVKSSSEFKAMREPEINPLNGNTYDPNIIVDKQDGSVFIGKSSIVGRNTTVNGYLCKLAFHNYSLSINEVKTIYNKGPTFGNGILGAAGIPYGVRSPLYKLD